MKDIGGLALAALAAEAIYAASDASKGATSWERLAAALPDGWSVVKDAEGRPLSDEDGAILRTPDGVIIATAVGTRPGLNERFVVDMRCNVEGIHSKVINDSLGAVQIPIRAVGLWLSCRCEALKDLIRRSPQPPWLIRQDVAQRRPGLWVWGRL